MLEKECYTILTFGAKDDDATLLCLSAAEDLLIVRGCFGMTAHAYHFLHLCFDEPQCPFEVGRLGGAFLAIWAWWEVDNPCFRHGGRSVYEEHGNCVLQEYMRGISS